MWTRRLRIATGANRIVVRAAPVRITHPRAARCAGACVLLACGLAAGLARAVPGGWTDLLQYVWMLLLLTPGLALAGGALAPRAVIEERGCELRVRYGIAGFERLLTAFPIDGVEMRVSRQAISAVRQDGASLLHDFGSFFLIFSKPRKKAEEVGLYVLELRVRGQQEWLPVLGSEVRSEVENARLAIAGAVSIPDEPEVEEVDEEGE